MKENSISYLNSKTWYRALKVFYIFIFIIFIIGANIFAFEGGVRDINLKKTIIKCNIGEEKTFSASDIGVSLNYGQFKNGFNYKKYFEGILNKYQIEKILSNCMDNFYDLPSQDVFVTQRIYEILGLNEEDKKSYSKSYFEEQFREMTSGNKTDMQKEKYLDYSVNLFDIEPYFSHFAFIKRLFLFNLMVIVAFEIIRRAFYYIILGKIRPKK